MNLQVIKAKSPEILLAAGITTVIGGVVATVLATHKAEKIISEHKKAMGEVGKKIEEDTNAETGEVANTEEHRHEVSRLYLKTGLKVAVTFSVPVALTATGIFCFTKSYSINKARLVAMSSAYTALNAAFQKYRERVIEDQGEEADYKYRYGVKKQTVTEGYTDENGDVKAEEKEVDVIDPNNLTEWGFIFDREHSSQYDDCEDYNDTFIAHTVLECNDLYFARSSNQQGITMNEIYALFGADHRAIKPSTKPEGQIFGFKDADGVGGVPFIIKKVRVEEDGVYKAYTLIDFCLPESLYVFK